MCIGETSVSPHDGTVVVNYPRDWRYECKSGYLCTMSRTNPKQKIGRRLEVLREALTALVIVRLAGR
ncbi:hypothetical protein PCA31118_01940 [Pandoraea captiosa]|jgi:hypothetical protein|uniref:Uncharacterized protein n=1 Tax=Pandoraea captiosa TaxID=2508302 RepID=A0A5E4ZW22_9BURK|nr:hypothetical protein PCA31118_01940 [Pandoraea captiosa]